MDARDVMTDFLAELCVKPMGQGDPMEQFLREQAGLPMNDWKPGRCNARNRRGTACRRYPIRGRRRCANHGGKSLRGISHPNYRDGRSSKDWLSALVVLYWGAREAQERQRGGD